MKRSFLLFTALIIGLLPFSTVGYAQTEEPAQENEAAVEVEPLLPYEAYTVKAYTITLFGGSFSGTRYLENIPLGPDTYYGEGFRDIMGYNGEVLEVSRDYQHYDAAHKEIDPGTTIGGRLGIYISDDFHLDLVGSYSTGKAVTTMLYKPDPADPSKNVRKTVDEDPDFSVYKGGINLMYDARPATIWGAVPHIGFGLGGIINRYSELEDITGLYLQGIFGLKYEVVKNLSLTGQVDVSTFAFKVEELGYSNMVAYTSFNVGLCWYIDVVPEQVRAARYARDQR